MAKKKSRKLAAAETTEKKPDCPACPPCGDVAPPPDLSMFKGSTYDVGETFYERGWVFPEYGYYRKSAKRPCALDKGKTFVSGRTDLAILTDDEAKTLGLNPGPALRLCLEENQPGPVVSVDTPEDAAKIATKFRECAQEGGKTRNQCATDTLALFRPGKPVTIGASPKKRRVAKKRAKK